MSIINQSKRRTGLDPLSYMGVEPTTPTQFVALNEDPTSTDYYNFNLGAVWLNTVTQDVWFLVKLAKQVATWVKFTGGNGSVLSLTGNTGGAVFPTAGNINVVGDAIGITIAGNPGTHTLTASLVGGGTAAQSFVTDSGTATPNSSGVLNIKAKATAGVTVLFNGSSNNVTLSVTDGSQNTLIGSSAGNTSLTGTHNTGVGLNVLTALTSGVGNAALGSNALTSVSSGSSNCGIIDGALSACTTGSNNIGIGEVSFQYMSTGSNNIGIGAYTYTTGSGNNGLLTGSNNIAIGVNVNNSGQGAGSAYRGAEGSNILIGSAGVTAESNVIRIGTQGSTTGTQQSCYLVGTTYVTGDNGSGVASTLGLTNTNSTTISTGVGSVKMSSANPATNAAWIKIYVGTTAYWIPAWTTNSP